MPDHLTPAHQAAAGRARWRNATDKDRAAQLRASAEAFLRRAEELDPTTDAFTASPDGGDLDREAGTHDAR